ncbi:MAG: zinc ribbon domain-containing protein [Oscillospiraceae bacterium]|nr:zinc ribbon domain-containing protein [Oscillospiraceae bacterium]
MKKCESCGKPFTNENDVFCSHCGAVAQKKNANSFDAREGSNYYNEKFNRENDYSTEKGGVENQREREQYSDTQQTQNVPYGYGNNPSPNPAPYNSNSGYQNGQQGDFNGGYQNRPPYSKPPKKKRTGLKVLIGFIAFIVAALIVFGVAVGIVFINSEEFSTVMDALTSEEYMYSVETGEAEIILEREGSQDKLIVDIDSFYTHSESDVASKEFAEMIKSTDTVVNILLKRYPVEKVKNVKGFAAKEEYVYDDEASKMITECYQGKFEYDEDLGYVIVFDGVTSFSRNELVEILWVAIAPDNSHDFEEDYDGLNYFASGFYTDICFLFNYITLNERGDGFDYYYFDSYEYVDVDDEEYVEFTSEYEYEMDENYYDEIQLGDKELKIIHNENYDGVYFWEDGELNDLDENGEAVTVEEYWNGYFDDGDFYDSGDIAVIGGADGPTKITVG